MLPQTTLNYAEHVLQALRRRGWRCATAESCTGGLIAAALTHPAGASDVMDRGFVVYANEAKTDLLGVPASLIEHHGAVSEAVALAMASGALERAGVDVAVSVTGIAGPGGGSAEKPVGLVWIGCATRAATQARRYVFPGDRAAVRAATVLQALQAMEESLRF